MKVVSLARLQATDRHVEAFKALAHATRLQIFFFLVRQKAEVAVGEIQAELEIPGPTLSHHLDVLRRADLYTQHSISREKLSVRQRMGELLSRLADGAFHAFESLFNVEEGRIGVVVTFLSMLELAKEQLLEVVQEEPGAPVDPRAPRAWPAPIYVKSLAASDAGAANDPEAFALPEPTSDEHGSPGADAGE